MGRARSTGRGSTTFLAPPRERPWRGGPEVRAQGRVPEVKGPCWWVTRGEVPGERRIPKSGSARSSRVSEVAGGRGSPIQLSGPRPAPPNQPGATGRAAGGLAPDRPGHFSARPLSGPAPASGGLLGPPSRPPSALGSPHPDSARPPPPRVRVGTGDPPGLSRPLAEAPCSNSPRVTVAFYLIKHFSC